MKTNFFRELPLFNVAVITITAIFFAQNSFAAEGKQKKDYVFLGFYRENSNDPVLTVPLKPSVTLQYSI